MKSKFIAAAGVVAVAAAALTGCASGSSSEAASCTNKIVNADAKQVTVWAWHRACPAMASKP